MELPGYQFSEKIGEGGMASVFKGQQLSLSRPVAIKVLSQQMRKHGQVREAFERESVIIARLSHPNIIHVIDRGITEQGTPYFIMEYVDGVDLATLLREGQIPLTRKVELCLQICKALGYAHKNGVIHRDIKPGNIIVDSDLHAKVLDFGIALFNEGNVSSQDGGAERSGGMNGGQQQDVMGTLRYMAPELHSSVSTATERSDIFSLGMIMYEMFAGQLPLEQGKPPSAYAPQIPESLDKLVMTCIAADATKRPASVTAVHDRLLLLLRGAHLNKQQIARAQESVNKKTFTLLDVLRENRFGAIYLFVEKNSGRQLVVKKRVGTEEGFDVGKRMANLNHDSIAKVYGVSKNPRAFIVVMDYMPGGSLQERLIRACDIETFLPLASQVCSGLAYAHSHRVIHGNLRASNVLFDEEGRVKIADFGLPEHYRRDLEDTPAMAVIGEASDAVQATDGKKNWYSLPDEPASPQKDIYACGVIFYQMLIGELPRWRQDKLQIGRAFKRLPGVLQEILAAMLERDLSCRTESIKTVLQRLDQLNDSLATQVWQQPENQPTELPRNGTGGKKRILLLLLLLLLFLVMVNTGVLVFLGWNDSVLKFAQQLLTTLLG